MPWGRRSGPHSSVFRGWAKGRKKLGQLTGDAAPRAAALPVVGPPFGTSCRGTGGGATVRSYRALRPGEVRMPRSLVGGDLGENSVTKRVTYETREAWSGSSGR